MATNYPVTLDTTANLPDPDGTDLLLNPTDELKHSYQHTTVNSAVRAIEEKLGIDASADVDSVDYKIRRGSFERQVDSLTTSSLAAGASDDTETLTLGKMCNVLRVETDFPAWVRVYASVAAQTADAGRLITDDPDSGAGVLLEVSTEDDLIINMSPPAWCHSMEASPGDSLPVTVTNLDSVSRTITVIVDYVVVEG